MSSLAGLFLFKEAVELVVLAIVEENSELILRPVACLRNLDRNGEEEDGEGEAVNWGIKLSWFELQECVLIDGEKIGDPAATTIAI